VICCDILECAQVVHSVNYIPHTTQVNSAFYPLWNSDMSISLGAE